MLSKPSLRRKLPAKKAGVATGISSRDVSAIKYSIEHLDASLAPLSAIHLDPTANFPKMSAKLLSIKVLFIL